MKCHFSNDDYTHQRINKSTVFTFQLSIQLNNLTRKSFNRVVVKSFNRAVLKLDCWIFRKIQSYKTTKYMVYCKDSLFEGAMGDVLFSRCLEVLKSDYCLFRLKFSHSPVYLWN